MFEETVLDTVMQKLFAKIYVWCTTSNLHSFTSLATMVQNAEKHMSLLFAVILKKLQMKQKRSEAKNWWKVKLKMRNTNVEYVEAWRAECCCRWYLHCAGICQHPVKTRSQGSHIQSDTLTPSTQVLHYWITTQLVFMCQYYSSPR